MAGKISPTTAKGTVQEITKEIHALEPSTPITLYEIDISEIKKNLHLGQSLTIPHDYLRFHNMEVLGQQTIIFREEVYHPMPIQTEGFELSSDGSVPRPTITFVSLLGISDEAATKSNFLALKRAILELENLIGAKVTRYRTFLKYLDPANTFPGVGEFTGTNPEFPRDIYFVERKMEESKKQIKLELSSVLDLQNFKLPSRLCMASRCPWNYRGHGCAYEYNATEWSDPKYGDDDKQKEEFGKQSHLPKYAPPVADDQNMQISGFGEVGGDSWVGYDISNIDIRVSGEYDSTTAYPTGAIVFVEKHNVRYYYMSKGNKGAVDSDHPLGYGPIENVPPPNNIYWYSDRCSKSLEGCKLRHGPAGAARTANGERANLFLPFGGFPGTNSRQSVQ